VDSQAQEQQAQSGAEQAPGYRWSWVRVGEWVTIGVLSWFFIALAGAIGPGVFLLVQHVFGYVVVPTHLLQTILYIGLTVVVGLVILIALIYVALRLVLPKVLPADPFVLAMALLGGVLGAAAAHQLRQSTPANEAQSAEHADPKEDAPATATRAAVRRSAERGGQR
jgi:hypothetical protein